MFNHYGSLATTVYQATKPVGTALNGDIDYYYERLKTITGKILEVGVGNGRLMIPLIQEGLDVEGIDLSPEMVAQCEKNCSAELILPPLYQGDIANYHFSHQFSAIIIPTSTFCLFESDAKLAQVLTNLLAHLEPGGTLIFDLDLPFYPEQGEIQTTSHRISDTTLITVENKTISLDWLTQHILYHLKYDCWEKGKLVASELQPLLLRWYGLEEIKLRLTAAGFSEITISADYDFLAVPYDNNQTLTIEARKTQLR